MTYGASALCVAESAGASTGSSIYDVGGTISATKSTVRHAAARPAAGAATSTSTPSAPVPSEEITDAPSPSTVAADVSALQDAYFQQTGSYLQILRGNGLPTYETGTVSEKLGENIPNDGWVHVYEAPGGKGYQVLYEADGVPHSVHAYPHSSGPMVRYPWLNKELRHEASDAGRSVA